MTRPDTSPDSRQRLALIDQAIRQRDLGRAKSFVKELNQDAPQYVEGWIAHARISQMAGDYAAMRTHLKTALDVAPKHPLARLMDAEALVHLGRIKEACAALQVMEGEAKKDGAWLARIAEIYTHSGQFEKAAACARQALEIMPDNASIRYNLASSLIAIGQLKQAEHEFDQLIALTPDDYDAYYNRASLRKQTKDHNHIGDIRDVLQTPVKNQMGIVQLEYALAKELEDIGEHEQSFAALKRGADMRRQMMSYSVETDTEAMAQIADTFGSDFFSKKDQGDDQPGPIFITGFPRSGTTLVDRIVSAHSEVESLGEITDFAMALTGLCRAQQGKTELIAAAATLNMKSLGAEYQRRARQRSTGKPFFIDKTPGNFLYIGLIAAALPQAKIIHLNRNLADTGFSMYKALFRMGYPFSYDLQDLATYIKAKEKLMDHWRAVLPGRIIDIQYEDIVANQETESRKIIAALGFDWQSDCLDFHQNKSPSATASAAQVRQPIYKSAVERWKLYEQQLAPLTRSLGISS